MNNVNNLCNLRSVLTRFQYVELKLKFDKHHFLMPQVEYLGHIISKEGLSPDLSKLDAILRAPPPREIRELRSFLGQIHFYRMLPS